jgi:hypothetical protein
MKNFYEIAVSRAPWLMPVVLAAWEADTERIIV